ncbi:hypothetical protein [Clostridium sp.]|uniref:hypothetical protein n=1 Tax=Clostridium sp. TaxID=1506 RepID=UPI003216CF39
MNYSDTKLRKIENRVGTGMFNMAISYVIDKGYESCKNITDEDILAQEGSGLMTKDFVQELIRTARDIAQNNSVWNDFLPYIRKDIIMGTAPTKELTLYKSMFSQDEWENILDDLDLEMYIDDNGLKERKTIQLVVVEELI